MESILTSIKKLLGIAEEYTHFDADLIMHINSVAFNFNSDWCRSRRRFFNQRQIICVGDFVPENSKWELIKSYTYMKVKLLFDPPLVPP